MHISRFVKNYGALWAWSAFMFEHYNGVIKQLFHGTQYITDQIVKSYNRLRFIKNNSYIFGKPECSNIGRNLFIKMMNQYSVKNCIEYGDDLKVFGKPRVKYTTVTEKIIIERLLGAEICEEYKAYDKFNYQNIVFHSTEYKRVTKRNNCITASS